MAKPPLPARFLEATGLPDTPLTRAATQLLTAHHPAWLVNHSLRTFWFGRAALQQLHPAAASLDSELLLVAALLHDVALGGALDDGVGDFQLQGAGVARDLVLSQRGDRPDAGRPQAGLVFDAVALHLELTSARDPRPEVAAVALGAALDVAGLRLDRLDPELVAAVLTSHPRDGAKAGLVQALTQQISSRPGSRIAGLEREVNLLAAIAAAPFAD